MRTYRHVISRLVKSASWLTFSLCATATGSLAASELPDVVVLSTTNSATHQRVTSALQTSLDALCKPPCESPPKVDALDITAIEPEAAESAHLLVAVGSRAANALARIDVAKPRLYGFIPHLVWKQLAACCDMEKYDSSAIFIDQPLSRQLTLARTLFRDARRIGVLLGPATTAQRDELIDTARRMGYDLTTETVTNVSDVGSRLRLLLQRSDVLLALPDPLIYNSNTIYSILLSSYSARIPVMGFSNAMVKAGAAAAVYTSPEDASKEIADSIDVYRLNGKLPKPHFGETFSVAVNEDVLRSLGIEAPTQQQVRERVMEASP